MTVVETTAVTSIDPLDAGSAILGNAVALVYAGLYTLDENGSAVLVWQKAWRRVMTCLPGPLP